MSSREQQPIGSTLGRLIRAAPRPTTGSGAQERCDLCGAPLASTHRHLLELAAHRLACACRPCVLLFDRPGAGGGRYRLIPERRRFIADFVLDDALWEQLLIPVGLAFFFTSSAAGRVVAQYPGPAGATESALDLNAWTEIAARNPLLAEMEPDVESLLVRRTAAVREHWLLPLDDVYGLVGLMRLRWRGLSGGADVRTAIEQFFGELRNSAVPVNRDGSPAQW